MSAEPDDAPDPEAEARAAAELDVLTPEPRARWRGELGAALADEAGRRGIRGPRPQHLWLRAAGLLAFGTALLALAAGRAL